MCCHQFCVVRCFTKADHFGKWKTTVCSFWWCRKCPYLFCCCVPTLGFCKVWNKALSFVKLMVRNVDKAALRKKRNVVNDRGPSRFLCFHKGISFTSPFAFINHSSQVQTTVSILMCQHCLRHKGTTRICDSHVKNWRRPARTAELSRSSNKHCTHTLVIGIGKSVRFSSSLMKN